MDQFENLKAELDNELMNASDNVGIAFGTELFKEFKKREWFTLETFGVLGTTLFSEQLPTYNKTHFVFQSWGINDLEYKIGQSK